MGRALAGFLLGLACLFTFSLIGGVRVFSAWERSSQSRIEKEKASDPSGMAEREYRLKRTKLAMNPFDLTNGLTFRELEEMPLGPGYRASAFLSVLAGLWLVWALRKSRSPS